MPDGPANPDTFDLPTAGFRGRITPIVLEETALAWDSADGPRRRRFDDIAAVELQADPYCDEPFARCDIAFSNGERLGLIITYDAAHAREVETYRAFLLRFTDVLGPEHRARILFRETIGSITRIFALTFSGGGIIALLATMVWLAASGEYAQDNQYLLFPLALLFICMLSGLFVVTLKGGPKPFDPMNIPVRLLPAVPRKRGT